MAKRIIETYFDYASPFCYLVWEPLEAMAKRHGASLDWKPVDLRSFSSFDEAHFSVHHRKYLAMDAMRLAKWMGVELRPPEPSRVRSQTALLLALLCQEAGGFRIFHREIFRSAWLRQRDISDREVLERCLRLAGAEPKALLDSAKASAIKAKLTALRVDAESRGVFGVPTMVLDGELFWGPDRLEMLEARLRSR